MKKEREEMKRGKNWRLRLKDYFYQRSIAGRIVMVISGLTVVTTVCFAAIVFILLQRRFIDTTATSAKKDLDMVLEKMDLFFEGVENDAVSVLVGESCQMLLENSGEFLEGDILKQHQKYRLVQQVFNSYIGQKSSYGAIVFYDLKGNHYTNDDYTQSAEYLEEQKGRIKKFFASGKQSRLFELHKSAWKQAREKKFSDCISYVHKVYSMKNGRLIGAIEIEIPNREISRLYETVMREGIRIYFLKKDQVILSGHEELLYRHMEDAVWYKELQKKQPDGEGFVVTDDYKDWYFLKEYRGQGWTAVNQVSKSIYFQDVMVSGVAILLIGAAVFLGSLVLVNFVVTSITRPLSRITETILEIGKGDYHKRVQVQENGEIGTLALEFNRMTERTERLLKEIVEKEKEKRESELSLIQLQMTPHFFYNILESICGLIVMDEKRQAIHTIQLLSGFYRGVLNKGREIITMEQELQISRNYLEIMKICYPDRFTYQISCEPGLKQNQICKLTLQPILENAVHHGFQEMEEEGFLQIQVYTRAEGMVIRVEDNGKGIDAVTKRRIESGVNPGFQMESFGLRNTNERIKLYFGEDYGLEILPKERGTGIRIVLPLKET